MLSRVDLDRLAADGVGRAAGEAEDRLLEAVMAVRRRATHFTYMSEPGVVSSSPVSSQVFRPERIIGQPP